MSDNAGFLAPPPQEPVHRRRELSSLIFLTCSNLFLAPASQNDIPYSLAPHPARNQGGALLAMRPFKLEACVCDNDRLQPK